MADTKNLCAQIPLTLHDRVCTEKDQAGLTTAQYITNLLTEYYQMKENGGNMNMAIPWRQSAAAMAAGSEWRIGITWTASGCLPGRRLCSADWRLTFEVKTWRSWSRSS